MSEFISLCASFMSGCAEFFSIPFPGLGGSITFFHVFVAFLAAHVILNCIQVVFGVHDDSVSVSPRTDHKGNIKFKA